jgi:hypothetical protein
VSDGLTIFSAVRPRPQVAGHISIVVGTRKDRQHEPFWWVNTNTSESKTQTQVVDVSPHRHRYLADLHYNAIGRFDCA